jgi:hypothetical protein
LHVPPPTPPISALAQKLSEPPSCVKVQHMLLLAPAPVQSAAVVQSWTVSVPEHMIARCVGHAEAALQADVSVPDVQLGTEPPVIGMDAQQTCPEQSAGDMHSELVPPLLLPLLLLALPLLLPLAPLLLPLPLLPPLLLVLPPLLLLPLLPPLLLLVLPPLLPLDPLLFDPPLLELPLLPLLPPPPPVELLSPLHAMSTTDATTNAY